MLVKHRSLHLDLIGGAPEIKRLFGGRRRSIYRCSLVNKTTDWFKANQARIFADFGSLSDSPFAVDGVTATTGIYDDDMRLISNDLAGGKEGPFVEFIYETLTDSWVQEVDDDEGATENGLKTLVRNEIARIGKALTYTTDSVGVATITVGAKTLYLSGIQDKSDDRAARMQTRWAEAGILDASKEFGRDGLLYVTFISQGTKFTPTLLKAGKSITDIESEAFFGGSAAIVRYSRVKDVNGFRKFTVTVMMKPDGTGLAIGSDNELWSYQQYRPYQKPGKLVLGTGSIDSYPGNTRPVLAQITEVLTTDGTMAVGYKPYSIANYANYYYSYVPSATGVGVLKTGSANGYLGTGDFAASGGSVFGTEVDSAIGAASSNPTPSAFDALANQVIDSDNRPVFVTDEGVKWYRKIKVQMVGTMAANLGNV